MKRIIVSRKRKMIKLSSIKKTYKKAIVITKYVSHVVVPNYKNINDNDVCCITLDPIVNCIELSCKHKMEKDNFVYFMTNMHSNFDIITFAEKENTKFCTPPSCPFCRKQLNRISVQYTVDCNIELIDFNNRPIKKTNKESYVGRGLYSLVCYEKDKYEPNLMDTVKCFLKYIINFSEYLIFKPVNYAYLQI